MVFKHTVINKTEEKTKSWDAKVARVVKCLTLDFCSGRDLMVCEFEPRVRLCAESVEHVWDSISSSLSAPHKLMHSLSLSLKNK